MTVHAVETGDDRQKLQYYFDHAPLETFGGYYLRFKENQPGVVDYMTVSLCTCLGYTQDEVMGMLHGEITRFVYPPDLEKYHCFIFDVATNCKTDSLIYRMSRKDGSFIYVIDTMRAIRRHGETIVFSAVVDINDYHIRNVQEQLASKVELFSKSYEQIIFIDIRRQIAQLLYGELKTTADGNVHHSLSLQTFLKSWADSCVGGEDRGRVMDFLSPLFGIPPNTRRPGESNGSITFENVHVTEDGARGTSQITLLPIGDEIRLLCYRDITTSVLGEHYREQNRDMRRALGNYRSLLEFVSDGLLTYREIDAGTIEILHCDRVACLYFEIPETDMASSAGIRMSMDAFVENSMLANHEFEKLIDTGMVDPGSSEGVAPRPHTHLAHAFDPRTELHWIAVTTIEESRGGELLAPRAGGKAHARPDVYIRTFGHFEVFVNGKPIAFRHEKSRELLALLVDRRGGFVSSRDAIGYLWENEPADKVTYARFRKIAMRLRNILEEHGIEDIVEVEQRSRRIDIEKVRCDLYDYLWGGPDYDRIFKGSYLTDYSWSEFTLMDLKSGGKGRRFEEE